MFHFFPLFYNLSVSQSRIQPKIDNYTYSLASFILGHLKFLFFFKFFAEW